MDLGFFQISRNLKTLANVLRRMSKMLKNVLRNLSKMLKNVLRNLSKMLKNVLRNLKMLKNVLEKRLETSWKNVLRLESFLAHPETFLRTPKNFPKSFSSAAGNPSLNHVFWTLC